MSSKIRIIQLALRNFGRHEDLTVEFSDTLTVIKGPNGSGKSTILHGVLVALFGVTAIDGTADDIGRTGSKGWNTVLSFLKGDVMYTVERTGSTASVKQHDGESSKTVATGTTAVNEEIESLFGMPKKTIIDLAYSEQTETATMMSLGATALNKMIERIAEADFISRVEAKSSSFALSAEIGLSSIDKPKDVGELRVQLTEAQANAAGSAARAKLAEDAYAQANTEAEAYKPVLTKAIKDTETLVGLNLRLLRGNDNVVKYKALADEALSSLSNILVRQEDLQAQVEIRDALQRTIRDKRDERTRGIEGTATIHRLEKWFAEVGDAQLAKYNELAPQLDAAAIVMKKAEHAARDAAAEHAAGSRVLTAAKRAIDEAICATCRRPLDSASLAEATANFDNLKARLNEKAESLATATAEEKTATEQYRRLSKECPEGSIVRQHNENRDLLETAKKSFSSEFPAKDEIDRLEAEYQTAVEEATRLRSALRQREEHEEKHAKADKMHAQAVIEIDEVKTLIEQVGEVNLDAVREKHSALTLKASQLNNEYASAKTSANSDSLTVKALENEIEKATGLMQKRASLERRHTQFTKLSKYLRDNRTTFMAEMWDQLMALTSEFVAIVSAGRIEKIERSDDGRFYYVEGGERRSCAKLAGGFRAVVGVGLRLALASLLPGGVSLVLLDEPSSELADDVAASLAAALRATDRQVVLITHRQGEEYVSDRVIELTL